MQVVHQPAVVRGGVGMTQIPPPAALVTHLLTAAAAAVSLKPAAASLAAAAAASLAAAAAVSLAAAAAASPKAAAAASLTVAAVNLAAAAAVLLLHQVVKSRQLRVKVRGDVWWRVLSSLLLSAWHTWRLRVWSGCAGWPKIMTYWPAVDSQVVLLTSLTDRLLHLHSVMLSPCRAITVRLPDVLPCGMIDGPAPVLVCDILQKSAC